VPSKFYNILASGRPTVAIVGPTCEVARVVAEADCGVQVDHGDVDRLTSVLSCLAGDEAARDRMGRNARKILERNYSLRHAADRFYRVFLEVLGTDLESDDAERKSP